MELDYSGKDWFVVELLTGVTEGRKPVALYGPASYPDCMDKLLDVGGNGAILKAKKFRANKYSKPVKGRK